MVPNYKVKLQAIAVIKNWFDRAGEPIVLSTGHLDTLIACIEEALTSQPDSIPPQHSA